MEPDELYVKYRIFHEPSVEVHPAEVTASYKADGDRPRPLYEVEGFLFPLKPDTDRHARVALAAYAESVRVDRPRLAEDLDLILADLRHE